MNPKFVFRRLKTTTSKKIKKKTQHPNADHLDTGYLGHAYAQPEDGKNIPSALLPR